MIAPVLPPISGRACVLDVDGTLLTSSHEVTPVTAAAVTAARARGIRVLLASSRGPQALRAVLEELGTPSGDAYIASQGAVIGRYSPHGEDDILVQRRMPLAGALALTRTALGLGIGVSWYAGAAWLVSHVDAAIAREAEIVRDTPVVADLLGQSACPDKLMFISPSGDPAEVAALAAAVPEGLHGQVSNPTYLEVTATGVDKASAVREWCALAGVAAAEVVAVGDGPNDIGVFGVAGRSFAPANARPEVIAAADAVAPSNDEDGIAWVLERMGR